MKQHFRMFLARIQLFFYARKNLADNTAEEYIKNIIKILKIYKLPQSTIEYMNSAFNHIIEQHVEQTAFLWHIYSLALNESHYTMSDLDELKNRINAQIDGMRNNIELSWKLAKEELTMEHQSEVFAASIVAIDTDNEAWFSHILTQLNDFPRECAKGMISALAWLPFSLTKKYIKKLLKSDSDFSKYIGIAACAIQTIHPKKYLDQAFTSSDPLLLARACKTVGELKLKDKLPILNQYLDHEDDKCRFYAALSSALLSENKALKELHSFVKKDSLYARKAIELIVKRLDQNRALKYIDKLAQEEDTKRYAIIAAGALGDPEKIPWLFEQMEIPEYARVAGESFSLITELDIAKESNMETDAPEGFISGPNDDTEDENVAIDEDEELPWPNVEKMREWWRHHRNEFT